MCYRSFAVLIGRLEMSYGKALLRSQTVHRLLITVTPRNNPTYPTRTLHILDYPTLTCSLPAPYLLCRSYSTITAMVLMGVWIFTCSGSDAGSQDTR